MSFAPRDAEWKFVTALPASGALNAPIIGALNIAIEPLFVWAAVAGATGYDFQISKNPDMSLPEWSQTVDQSYTVVEFALDYSETYYWRVRARKDVIALLNGSGLSAWTTPGIFTTVAEPTEAQPPVVVQENPPSEITVEIPTQPFVIPPYLLWTIIGIGAVLIVALIVLIVRTRRVA